MKKLAFLLLLAFAFFVLVSIRGPTNQEITKSPELKVLSNSSQSFISNTIAATTSSQVQACTEIAVIPSKLLDHMAAKVNTGPFKMEVGQTQPGKMVAHTFTSFAFRTAISLLNA